MTRHGPIVWGALYNGDHRRRWTERDGERWKQSHELHFYWPGGPRVESLTFRR
jgi:hypothetical protein